MNKNDKKTNAVIEILTKTFITKIKNSKTIKLANYNEEIIKNETDQSGNEIEIIK